MAEQSTQHALILFFEKPNNFPSHTKKITQKSFSFSHDNKTYFPTFIFTFFPLTHSPPFYHPTFSDSIVYSRENIIAYKKCISIIIVPNCTVFFFYFHKRNNSQSETRRRQHKKAHA